MGMAAILFHSAEPFEQIFNIPSAEGPMSSAFREDYVKR